MALRSSMSFALCLAAAAATSGNRPAARTVDFGSDATTTTTTTLPNRPAAVTTTTTTTLPNRPAAVTTTTTTALPNRPAAVITTTLPNRPEAVTETTTTTETGAPSCDEKFLAMFKNALLGLGEVSGCMEKSGRCELSCTDTWTDVFDICVGQNSSLLGEGSQPFEPASFVAAIIANRELGQGACASVPLTVVLGHPGVRLDCADTVGLMGAGGQLCGEVENQTACSQTCQDALLAPIARCKPNEQVPLALGSSGRMVDAQTPVVDQSASYSAACLEAASFQALRDEWLATRTSTHTSTTVTSTIVLVSECDASFLRPFQGALGTGELAGCVAKGQRCEVGCAGTWAEVFDTCIGQNSSLLGEGPAPFSPVFAATTISGLGEPGPCSGVPIAAVLDHPNVTLDCVDSIRLMSSGCRLCGEGDVCSQTCQDVLLAPLRNCAPTEQVPADVSSPPGGLVDARVQVTGLSSSFSGACLAAARFQPLLEDWQATTTMTSTALQTTATMAIATTSSVPPRETVTALTTRTTFTSTTATRTAIRASVITTGALMRVDQPEQFATDPAIHSSLTNSYASLARVASSQCEVTMSVVGGQPSDRRLRMLSGQFGQSGQVQVSVVITLLSSSQEPDAASVVADALNNLDASSLASQLESDLEAAGFEVAAAGGHLFQVETVESASVEDVTLTWTTTTATATTATATATTAAATTVAATTAAVATSAATTSARAAAVHTTASSEPGSAEQLSFAPARSAGRVAAIAIILLLSS